MKLTVAERSMLINQFLMMKLIDKEDSTSHYSAEDYDNYIDILFNGYEGFYDRILPNPDYDIGKDVSDEVYDILYMYDRATISYEKLIDNEKSAIDKYKITFSGFDGQTEYDHCAIAKFIIKNLKEFSYTFKNEDLDSHSPRLNKYRRQLKLYEEYKNSGDLLDLNGLTNVFG